MNKILIYNTLGRKKEEFKPLANGKLSFYYCGPTVYWTQHIGNLRGSVCADVIHRTFKYLNYEVSMVRNYTDVGHLSSDADEGEDKMEKASKRENLKPEEIASKYIANYEDDAKKINILDPRHKPRATEYIAEMIEFVQVLVAKSYAYSTDLAIYFDVSKFKDYTLLSGQKLDKNKAMAGQGGVFDDKKKNQQDFALWFFKAGEHKNSLQFWPSPFFSSLASNGEGFPGWHLECSAMIKSILGNTIDIHMGGIEHIGVHHTNEIAQSECANGVKFTNYWLHNEHLLFNDSKMSKSEGTAYSLSEVEGKGFSPTALRLFFLQAHYRSKQNFTFEALKASQIRLLSIFDKVSKLGNVVGSVSKSFRDAFLTGLLDDFNIAKTLAIIPDIFKSDLSNDDKLATLLDFDRVWGLNLGSCFELNKEISQAARKIAIERDEARSDKDYEKSDKLRSDLENMGYKVEDSASGTILK